MAAARIHDCFISHASEDKAAIARPLADALRGMGYDVWYDEFELEIGDSLREKIDRGLAQSRFGVVILSERFFEKKWSSAELDALVARQMIGSERIILPVWHQIDEEYLERASPILANIIGVSSSPLEGAVRAIARKIERRKEQGSSGGALVTAQESAPAPPESDPELLVRRAERVKLGYSPEERSRFQGEGGSLAGPGWLSIVVGPVTLKDDLIDPVEVSSDRISSVTIEDRWYISDALRNQYGLRAGLDGFVHRFPEQAEALPGYWVKIWQDGLMEFGETITIGGDDTRLLPYVSMTEQIHDYVLLFLAILDEVGYDGDAAAVVTLGDVKGFELGISPGAYFPFRHPIEGEKIVSRVLRGSAMEMRVGLNAWLKKTMDRLFLACGIEGGAYFMTDEGTIREQR